LPFLLALDGVQISEDWLKTVYVKMKDDSQYLSQKTKNSLPGILRTWGTP